MNEKKIVLVLLCIVIGLSVGLWGSELILRILWGDPCRESMANHSSYYEFEIYDRLFKKERLSSGDWVYRTQRSGVFETTFSAVKPRNTKRVFILGESVAADFGSRSSLLLKSELQKYFPSCNFEVVPCMTVGYDSYRVYLILKEIVNYQPDLILLFVGNNSGSHLRSGLSLTLYAKTWIYRLLDRNFIARSTVQRGENEINSAFLNDLEQMSKLSRQKKIPLAIFTLPVNFKDLPPSGPGWFFNRNRFMARIAFEKGHWDQAISLLKNQLTGEDKHGNSQIYHAIGQCLERKLKYSQAREYYLKALALEGELSWRCSARKNSIIRETSRKNDLILVDLEKKFISIAPHGLLGDEFFKDNCHWLEPYDKVVIEELISSLQSYLKRQSNSSFGPGLWNSTYGALADQEALQSARKLLFGETLLAYYCLSGISYILQGKEAGLSLYFFNKAVKYIPNLLVKTAISKEKVRRQITENSWVDPVVDRLDASWPEILWQTGEAFREKGNYTLALDFFNRSLKIKGERNNIDPYLLRGLTFFLMGNQKKAIEDWKVVIKIKPDMMWLREINPG